MQDAFSQEKVNLSAYRGKVICLEFWSTECGHCQQPMAHLCDVKARNQDEWQDRVALFAVSTDDRKDILVKHVRQRDWLAVRHLWARQGESGMKSEAEVAYGVKWMSTIILINQEGVIDWRGHPKDIDIEKRINELLAE